MLDLAGADAEGQRAEGAVGRGMGVTTHHGGAGQGKALLRADDMNDALARIVHAVDRYVVVRAVFHQGFDLNPAFRVGNAARAVGGRHVVVRHGEGQIRPAHLAPGEREAFKGLRRGHFVDQVAVDVDQ